MNQTVLDLIPRERQTQKQDILDYLNRNGSLTRMEAFSQLGVCELSSRIGELERDGWHFPREWLDGRAANGRKWRVVRYLRPERRSMIRRHQAVQIQQNWQESRPNPRERKHSSNYVPQERRRDKLTPERVCELMRRWR